MGAQIQPRDVGSLSDTWKRMISYLRKYLRDFASINKLIEGEESKDNDLAFAILQTVEDINGTPHLRSIPWRRWWMWHIRCHWC